jgi:DNA-binding NarL/FixJ family response regulator
MGIILFSAYEDRGSELFDLLDEGVRGIAYLLKGTRPDTLLKTIGVVAAGRVCLDPEVTPQQRPITYFLNHLAPSERTWVEVASTCIEQLSPREREVADRLAAAHNIKGIATELGITAKSVSNYTQRIYNKLALNSIDEQAPFLRKSVILAKALLLHDLQQESSR